MSTSAVYSTKSYNAGKCNTNVLFDMLILQPCIGQTEVKTIHLRAIQTSVDYHIINKLNCRFYQSDTDS